MNAGDRIKIITKESDFEGIYMPRPEMLEDNIIVLKLDSGYNIGIDKNTIQKTEVIEKYKEKTKKKITLQENPQLPTVAILSLGGTISSSVDYTSGGVKAVSYTAEDFVAMCPDLKDIANLKAESVLQIMSEDVDLSTIVKIAQSLQPWIENKNVDGIVVTLGTDCFHYITSALTFMIKTEKPIIFTATQRSIDRGSSDAYMNLSCAVKAAATWDGAEIVSCMHENTDDTSCILIRGNKVRKMHTSRRDAFRPINILPYARITYPDLKIENIFDTYRKKKDEKNEFAIGLSKDVALLHIHPGIDPEVIDFYVKKGIKGLVLAGTALGHVPTDGASNLLPSLEKALKKGVIVVVATQTLYGRTHPYVYTNLRKLSLNLGCLFAEDMLPETAYMKLSWLLSQKLSDKEVQQKFVENLAGEINPILDVDNFLY